VAEYFRLDKKHAREIATQIAKVVRKWSAVAEEADKVDGLIQQLREPIKLFNYFFVNSVANALS